MGGGYLSQAVERDGSFTGQAWAGSGEPSLAASLGPYPMPLPGDRGERALVLAPFAETVDGVPESLDSLAADAVRIRRQERGDSERNLLLGDGPRRLVVCRLRGETQLYLCLRASTTRLVHSEIWRAEAR
jgi:hypothetical protein